MPAITIRAARPTDAAQIALLSEELGYPVAPDEISRRLTRLLPRAEHIILVAESPSDGVVGWTHAAEQDLLESGRTCEIMGLVVGATQRGHGVGRLFINEIEQWALRHGLNQISVRSNVIRTESHPFYERVGFTRVKTQHAYRKALKT